MVHTKLKNNDDARFQFEKALELDKNHINSLLNLASLYRKCGKFTDALRLGKKAKKADPNNISVLNNLGNTLVDCNFINEAVLTNKKAIRIDPESGLYIQSRGWAMPFNLFDTLANSCTWQNR